MILGVDRSWWTGKQEQRGSRGKFLWARPRSDLHHFPSHSSLLVLKRKQSKIYLTTQNPRHFSLFSLTSTTPSLFFFLLPKFLSGNNRPSSGILIYLSCNPCSLLSHSPESSQRSTSCKNPMTSYLSSPHFISFSASFLLSVRRPVRIYSCTILVAFEPSSVPLVLLG